MYKPLNAVELYGRKARLLFRLAAQASSELTSTFLRGFQATQANYFHSIVVKVVLVQCRLLKQKLIAIFRLGSACSSCWAPHTPAAVRLLFNQRTPIIKDRGSASAETSASIAATILTITAFQISSSSWPPSLNGTSVVRLSWPMWLTGWTFAST